MAEKNKTKSDVTRNKPRIAPEKTKGTKEKIIVEAKKSSGECSDRNCHIHGNLKVRGRTFEGRVIKKFAKRVVIEFERMIYVRKYERYMKGKTKIHAHLPMCMENQIHVGDLIKVQECRPLSKIIHFTVIEKIKSAEEKK